MLDIVKCGANLKMQIGPDEALITTDVVYLLCNAGNRNHEYQLSFPNPLSHKEGGVEWKLRYGSTETRDKISVSAAGQIEILEHLVRDHSMKEITDRLRRMRRAYRAIVDARGDLLKAAALNKEG